MGVKIDKVKKHFSDNRQLYIGAGIGVAVGAITATIVVSKVNVTQVVIGNNNHLEQTTLLVRRGHPGFVIKCIETGEVFASQGRAAIANGVDKGAISKHLNGLTPHIKGLHFERIGEATT